MSKELSKCCETRKEKTFINLERRGKKPNTCLKNILVYKQIFKRLTIFPLEVNLTHEKGCLITSSLMLLNGASRITPFGLSILLLLTIETICRPIPVPFMDTKEKYVVRTLRTSN